MGEIVELAGRQRKRARRRAAAAARPAMPIVFVPNERLSRLRDFWTELKAEIAALSNRASGPLSRS